MNISLMQKSAKLAGVNKEEFSVPLDYKTNLLYCWDAAWMATESDGPNDMLILKNRKTDYIILILGVYSIDKGNIKEIIEEGLANGLKALNIDQEYIDNYLEKAGSFNYGLINEYKTITRLKTIVRFLRSGIEQKRKEGTSLELTGLTRKEYAELSRELIPLCLHNYAREKSGSYGDIDISQMEKALIQLKDEGEEEGNTAFEFLVTLDLEIYKVTRRIVIPADYNFSELHLAIQEAFGWENRHSYEFSFSEKEKESYPEQLVISAYPRGTEATVGLNIFKLSDLVKAYNKLTYIYDFNCYWEHNIELVNVYDNYSGEIPYLVEAKRNRPPEDIGGTWDFVDFYKEYKNSKGKDTSQKKNWPLNWREELTKTQRIPHKMYPAEYTQIKKAEYNT